MPSDVATNKKQPAKKKTTKVLAGATLWSIAKDNHVSVPELVKANPQIKDKNLG
ncbi:LysM peptidoglycan-binding domain-containing protein [Candidatus Kurthia intestinigallinarum]|uniref:LysM peptidoglycan-binding domain-containing protein n=1 Tax=Candidatus Kurthia intestinigallinarum TaxID=1562256 RepID=UPI000F8E6636|nr:LysM domain-containing protein [Kurthia sp. 3B1D]